MKDEDFANLVKKLQQKIEYDEEKNYSKIVIREYKNPTNFGVLDNPDIIGIVKGPCGDTMKITLRIKDNKITKTRFWTDGCGATIACGSILTKLLRGKTIKEADEITTEELIKALDGLPKEHCHCAVLAIDTLHKSIKNYHNNKNSSKKQLMKMINQSIVF